MNNFDNFDNLNNFDENQIKKIKELEKHINSIKQNLKSKNIINLSNCSNSSNSNSSNNFYNLNNLENISPDYQVKIVKNYLDWISRIRKKFVKIIGNNELYYFFEYDPKSSQFELMRDYWDVPQTDKLFSFSLFISNIENLSYLIGLVYNYAIMRKHFSEYKMRLYIDFHSVFGSAESFNLFNMFIDILEDIDPTFNLNIQMIVFFLNPYYYSNSTDTNINYSIYEPIIYDIKDVIEYYNVLFYSQAQAQSQNSPKLNNWYDEKNNLLKSPLLNIKLEELDSYTNKTNDETIFAESVKTKDNIKINIDNLEINYKNLNKPTPRSTFAMFSTHLAVNLRFLPLNEDCEFHVRDLDSRLCLTDINVIKKFSNPKYKYVPFYVFQFYKFYFPYLKWRIDVNPYLAGCFGGSNKKPITISKELEESGNLKILKKEIFFKYILFISFNASNLQIGFLNDEFILANIFEKIKGSYSENILYLNLGSFANKHVNEFYYGMSKSSNYPCMLKLGTPIDILRYPLNGKYITIDPITDFKINPVPLKFHPIIKKLITEQLEIYFNKVNQEKINLANNIRKNYKSRLDEPIRSDLESALFFSMVKRKYDSLNNYTLNSFSNQFISNDISNTLKISNNDNNLKPLDIMMAGYLLADILEDIIFPTNPKFINSNYFLSDDNYDRLFNCMYWNDTDKKFVQRKINKNDIARKYIDQNIISHIPSNLIEFDSKQEAIETINKEFNKYISTSSYYPSLAWYIKQISFNKSGHLNNFINIGGKKIKSGMLLFIRDYSEPIYSTDFDPIYSIDSNSIKTLKYNLAGKKDLIKGIEINKNKLKYNVILVDDESINQFTYSQSTDKEKINIKLLKMSHLDKLEKITNLNKYSDYIVIDHL